MVKNKRLVKYFFGLSLFLFLIVPIVNTIGFFTEHKFKQFRKVDKNMLFNTDKVQSVFSYLAFKIFDKSLFPNYVVTGKDGFLFLGNGYADVLDKSSGTFMITDEEIIQFTEKLYALQNWYENQGIKFVMTIAPNKHSIYKEKLPNWAAYDGDTVTDRIIVQSKRYDINLVDLRPALLEAKASENRLLYQKTDTHWNMLGASYGYEKTIDYMNEKFELNVPKPIYKVEHLVAENHRGGLFRFLKANETFNIQDYNTYDYNFQNDVNVCHGKIGKKSGKLKKCNDKENPIMAIKWQPQYMINNNVPKVKLLFLCDSFATTPSKLYNASFNTMYKLSWGGFKGKRLKKFIKRNKPDIVLYQIVERAILKPSVTSIVNKGKKHVRQK